MPHKKRKCVNCKEFKPVEEGNITPSGFICSGECAIEYSRKQFIRRNYLGNKGKRKTNNNQAASDLRVSKRAAIAACHKYIRERDRGGLCICCGEPLKEEFHAGHFWNSGNYPYIRFDEDNIHGQNIQCNYFKGGDSGYYRERLIEKIGLERVKRLDDNRSKSIKRTFEDYREIERYYKQKLKDLIQSRKETNRGFEMSGSTKPKKPEPKPKKKRK